MGTKDLLFEEDDFTFSYRVAGILINNGKILLEKTTEYDNYAFPGGHVAFSETNEETLIREFKEETGMDIIVKEIKWVAEIFFPWNNKPCHQICLYYMVEPIKNSLVEKNFTGKETIQNNDVAIEFHWIPLENIGNIPVYPPNAAELLKEISGGVKHFVYKQNI